MLFCYINVMNNKIINYFIPKNTGLKDFTRNKIIISALLGFTIIMFIYTCFYFFNGIVTTPKAIYNYIGLLLMISSLIIIKVSQNIKGVLVLMNFSGFLLITVSVYLSGGIFSYDLLWYLVLLISSIIFIGVRYGTFLTVLCLVMITFFYLAETLDLISFPKNEVSLGIHYKFINTFLVLTIASIVVLVLVRGNKKLQLILQKNKEKEIRVEIARDFHDQIGNQLASINQLASVAISQKENEELLTRIEEKSKEVYNNFRDFIWFQNEKSDDVREVFMYLKDFGEDFLKFSEIKFYASYNIFEDNIKLPSFSSKEIIPLFKEGVTNAIKHSKASFIELKCEKNNDNIVFSLIDDGVGFDVEEASKGMGLSNIRNRAKKINSDLKIDSTKGTIIKLIIKNTTLNR